eukprot:8015210-Alexandrium_andersonii.AAC.1
MHDMVVIDEISLYDYPLFERIFKLFNAAEKAPVMVLGDKYQLPGVRDTRPWRSRAWKHREH